jgi:hypothetical protein
MDGYVVHRGMSMARGSSLRIEDGAGILVYVREGELWITQEGDSRDYFVNPGGWFRLERNGASLLYATRSTHASLAAPTPDNYARLITLTPAGTATPRLLYEGNKRGRTPFLSFRRLGTWLARPGAWQASLESKAEQSPR